MDRRFVCVDVMKTPLGNNTLIGFFSLYSSMTICDPIVMTRCTSVCDLAVFLFVVCLGGITELDSNKNQLIYI